MHTSNNITPTTAPTIIAIFDELAAVLSKTKINRISMLKT